MAFSAYLNAGQACSATERVIVQRPVRDALVERVMERTARIVLGDPLAPGTTMGPLNNESVAQKMDRHIADAVVRGATVLTGGKRANGFPTDLFYEPTVLVDVKPDMEVSREESFGPIVPVLEVDSHDEAIAMANDNPVGLICSVYTKNLKAAFHYAERLRTGIVNINETPDYWEMHVPYGGVAGKQSGIGRLGGMSALREMVDVRTMSRSTWTREASDVERDRRAARDRRRTIRRSGRRPAISSLRRSTRRPSSTGRPSSWSLLALVAAKRWDTGVRVHAQLALEHGASPDEVRGAILMSFATEATSAAAQGLHWAEQVITPNERDGGGPRGSSS